jgi:transcriptional regulator with XRE-family HTH domain
VANALEMEAKGRFGTAFATALREHEMGLRELAAKTDGTYEHMRKLAKGLAYPSKYLLKEICKVLKLDMDEMDKLITQDKLQLKYGTTLNGVLKRDPRISEYEALVPHLSDDQNEMFLTQMRAVVRQHKSAKRG